MLSSHAYYALKLTYYSQIMVKIFLVHRQNDLVFYACACSEQRPTRSYNILT